MRHEGIISNEQSDDVQKGNDVETLNSIRTAHIERRRNTGQSWKSARMARYQLNRNQTKGGIDYSFHWWMWVVYSHPKIAYLFLRIPRRFIVRFNHKRSLSQDRNAQSSYPESNISSMKGGANLPPKAVIWVGWTENRSFHRGVQNERYGSFWISNPLKCHFQRKVNSISFFYLHFCVTHRSNMQKQGTQILYQYLSTKVVEARGIEPLSEDSATWASPSAACVLEFPHVHAHRQAYTLGSFINPTRSKAYAGWFPTLMTPSTRAVGSPGSTGSITLRLAQS